MSGKKRRKSFGERFADFFDTTAMTAALLKAEIEDLEEWIKDASKAKGKTKLDKEDIAETEKTVRDLKAAHNYFCDRGWIMKDRRWSPADIELLLHIYYSNEEPSESQKVAWKHSSHQLIGQDLIAAMAGDKTGTKFYLTDKGKAMVYSLLRVPLPKSVFINPITGEMLGEDP